MPRRTTYWIQAVLRTCKRGALHRQLHVPVGERIPTAKLKRAAKAPGKLGKRARLALTLIKLSKHRHARRRHKRNNPDLLQQLQHSVRL